MAAPQTQRAPPVTEGLVSPRDAPLTVGRPSSKTGPARGWDDGPYGGHMVTGPSRSLLVWTWVLAPLVVLTSVAGLADARVYAEETENWALQAKGQDWGNLLAVVALVVAALRHRMGSHRAGLVWLGTVLYLTYAFIVYAFAVHLNYLFLAYVAVLGVSAWAMVFTVDSLRHPAIRYPQGRARTLAAWVIIVIGVMFAGLWLSELVPALLAGKVPDSLAEAGLWVNPIHVIDLSTVLPAFVITGIGALRSRERGLFWLAPWLVFSALMGSSIVAAMILMTTAGATDTVPAMVMVSLLVAASLATALGYLKPPAAANG